MWRLILISFGFLGFAFYHLSGGSDYAPAPDSLQVALQDEPLFAPPRQPEPETQIAKVDNGTLPAADTASAQQATAVPAPSKNATRVGAGFSDLSGIDKDAHNGFEIPVASTSRSLEGGDAMDGRALDRVGTFSAETLASDVRDTPIDEAVVTAQRQDAPQPQDTVQREADIRSVTGSRANMRRGPGTDYRKVAQLTEGTQVEVLDRRGAWVELRDIETGRTGWMADWLITAAN